LNAAAVEQGQAAVGVVAEAGGALQAFGALGPALGDVFSDLDVADVALGEFGKSEGPDDFIAGATAANEVSDR
jgi:hypothetical protein